MRNALAMAAGLVVIAALGSPVEAATIFVANNGVDPPGCVPLSCVVAPCRCGTKTAPCRSITCGIITAAPGDTVVVGPGKYGDLDGDGFPGDSTGEEAPEFSSPGCDCLLALNKAVSLQSSNGAAETVIDATHVGSNRNVVIVADGASFGAPGKGFLVTQSGGDGKGGMVIDANDVAVRGNQLVPVLPTSVGRGIETADSPASVVIEGNQVVGWAAGIAVAGGNKTVRNNVVMMNFGGIFASPGSIVTGNVTIGNTLGIALPNGPGTVMANAAIGNDIGIGNHGVGPPGGGTSFIGTVEKNDVFGNGCGTLNDGLMPLVADKNYWGAATGPGANPADDACNTSNGTTATTPFAKALIKVKPTIKP